MRVRMRLSLDGLSSGRRSSVTLSMRMSGRLRSMGIGRRSRGVRGSSVGISGAVDWLREAICVVHWCTIAVLGVLGVRLAV